MISKIKLHIISVKKLYVLTIILFTAVTIFCQVKNSGIRDSITDTLTNNKRDYVKLIIRNAPSLTLELNLLYNYGVYELSGNYNGDFSSEQFIDGENFGVRHGIGGMLTAKIPLHKKGYVRANISLLYVNFSSKFNKTLNNGKENEFAKYNVYSVIAGIENNFTPNFKFKTFAGLGLIGSVIYGDAYIVQEKKGMNINIIPAFRLGLCVTSGLEYMLNNSFGFSCGIRFTHANLWLKDSKVSSNPNEIYLNDARTAGNLPFTGFKQFAWGSFFAGINYFFDIKEKEYYYKKR